MNQRGRYTSMNNSLEKRVEAVVLARFGLLAEMSPEVKRADLVLLATEQRDLFGKAVSAGMALPQRITPLPARDAKLEFLARYSELAIKSGAEIVVDDRP
ncbi:MAG: hypothetical protein A2514_15920 [Gammaproteobacteria bacterium RIFOXYD12_FULL_61_37]|nr:MAG: hypothetical protein A2514_15920 [Gammaproteobacteria bacterium RIFOXYD12_FULL_61_37]